MSSMSLEKIAEIAQLKNKFILQFEQQCINTKTTTAANGHIIATKGHLVINFYPSTQNFFVNKEQSPTKKCIRGNGFNAALKLFEKYLTN